MYREALGARGREGEVRGGREGEMERGRDGERERWREGEVKQIYSQAHVRIIHI